MQKWKSLLLAALAVGMFLSPSVEIQAATPYKYCFIGDSRFVGMEMSVNTDEDIVWVAKNGANQSWYWENRDQIASMDRDTVIVFELGVNDFDVEGCLNALRDLEALGFRHIYYTSVTPVDEGKEAQYGHSATNKRIKDFNETIRQNLPETVAMMDGYEYLTAMGVSTVDGVHYTAPTYQNWLTNIMGSL